MEPAPTPWNLYLFHGAVRAADHGSKQLSLVSAESLYREYKARSGGDPNQFVHKTSSGKTVTVVVHEGVKCPFPPPA